MRSDSELGKTDQSASAIDADVARPDAVHPFGLAELPESLVLHLVGQRGVDESPYERGDGSLYGSG